MWRKHVMLRKEEAPGFAEAQKALEPMVKKAALMALLYLLVPLLLSPALTSLGLYDRMWRGWTIMLLLWVGHLDAASWRASPAFMRSTRLGAVLCHAVDLARRRPNLLSLLALAPLVSALLAVRIGMGGISGVLGTIGKFGFAALLWLDAMLMVCSWAAMIAPSTLSLLERSSSSRIERVAAVARQSGLHLAVACAAWGMFCWLAGWR